MSSQIHPHILVPKPLCQKESCRNKSEKSRLIFSCNLQKNLDVDSITSCSNCVTKKKDKSIKSFCQINLEDLHLILMTQKKLEKEILDNLEELTNKLGQILQNAKKEIENVEKKISDIGKTIRQMCLFQQGSMLEEFINKENQAPQDLLINMIQELRDKIFLVEEGAQNSQPQIRYNQDKLNVIFENGTIRIDDFLKDKLQQMSQMINCFEKQVSLININNSNFTLEIDQNITSNYKKIESPKNLSAKKIYNLRFNRSNNLFAFGTSTFDSHKANCVEIWKIDNDKIEFVQRLNQYPDVTALCFAKKDDSLITGGLDSKILFWSPQPNRENLNYELGPTKETTTNGSVNCIEINQKSNILAIGSEELMILRQNMNKWEIIIKFQQEVKNLAFSNCNKIIIAQCMRDKKEKIELYQIQEHNDRVEIIHLGEVNQPQENQAIPSTRFMFINFLNQVKIYKLDNNRPLRVDNDSIEKLNLITKNGIGFCSNNNTSSRLAFSQNVNNNQVTYILKINEQNQVTLLQSIQQMGQKLFFSNGGQVLVIWDGNSLYVFKDKSNAK